MYRKLWDISGGKPEFVTFQDVYGYGTAVLVAAASVRSDKRIVPIYMLFWSASGSDVAAIGLRTSTGVRFFSGAGDGSNYATLTSFPVFMDFGYTFINRGVAGAGLSISYTVDTAEAISGLVGYYII